VGEFLGVWATGRELRLTSSAVVHVSAGVVVHAREISDDGGCVDQARTIYVITQQDSRSQSTESR
jgi:hypothetical protein